MSNYSNPQEAGRTSAYHAMEDSDRTTQSRKPPRRTSGWRRFLAVVLTAAVVGGLSGVGTTYLLTGGSQASVKNITSRSQNQEEPRVVHMDSHGNLSTTDIAAKVMPTVVGITNYGTVRDFFGSSRTAARASGSGVILDEEGTIVTNYHVIANATNIQVTVNGNEQHDARVLGFDEASDLALLKIDAGNLTPIEIGDSNTVQVGDLAVAVGNPLGEEFSQSVTDGIISGINRRLQQDNQKFELIQTNCAINTGNSGGALVDGQGRLIGINSAKILAAGVEGLGFAIPVNNVMDIVEEIQVHGHVEKPYIGISGYSLTPELSALLQVAGHERGIIVAQVTERSPAAEAGIAANDVIFKADDKDIESFEDLSALLNQKKPGDSIRFGLDRGGEKMEIDVILGTQSGIAT